MLSPYHQPTQRTQPPPLQKPLTVSSSDAGMPSNKKTTTSLSSLHEVDPLPAFAGYDPRHDHDYDDMYDGDGSEMEDDDVDVDDDRVCFRMSRLSIETSECDADTDLSSDDKKAAKLQAATEDDDDDDDAISVDSNGGLRYLSAPGTPARLAPRRLPESPRPAWGKAYASETEAGGGGRKRGDRSRSSYLCRVDSQVERAWETRRWCHSGGSSPCVVVRPRGRPGAAPMCMDMDEVRACRDLGLDLPCDSAVEIPPAAFDTSSGGDSPIRSWRTPSSPGDDTRDMKARLRVWAQAVALASASRLCS